MLPPPTTRRSLNTFVFKVLGVTAAAATAFHIAMDHKVANRPESTVRQIEDDSPGEDRNPPDDPSTQLDQPFSTSPSSSWSSSSPSSLRSPPSRRHKEYENSVANQNANFRRFLHELGGKDADTKINEAVAGLLYFMVPSSIHHDVKLGRVRHPASPPPPPPTSTPSSTPSSTTTPTSTAAGAAATTTTSPQLSRQPPTSSS